MKLAILFLIILALPVMAADYGSGDYGNSSYENGTEESSPPASPPPSSGGGGSGGVGFGNFSPPKKNVTINQTMNNTPPVQIPAAPSLPEQVDEILEDIFKDVPWIVFEINTTKLIGGFSGWAGETSENVQMYVMEGHAVETLQTYLLQATDLPNYSFKAKILLIFTIISLVFIIVKPSDGSEHPIHGVMKRVVLGHKDKKKEGEKKPSIHHRIKHHVQNMKHAVVNKISNKSKENATKNVSTGKKFVGKIRFNDGRSEYCYESDGKAVVCHGHLAQLASELKKKYGSNFQSKLTYEAPHKKLNGAKFVELASIEQHNLEKLIKERKPPVHHQVVHKAKHAVHKVHHTAKKVVHHVVKHVPKPRPVINKMRETVEKKAVKPVHPTADKKPRPKKDKYLDFYKKVKKAKSLKEISEV